MRTSNPLETLDTARSILARSRRNRHGRANPTARISRASPTRLIIWTLVSTGAVYVATEWDSNALSAAAGDRSRRARGGRRDRGGGQPRRGPAALDRGKDAGPGRGALGAEPDAGRRRSTAACLRRGQPRPLRAGDSLAARPARQAPRALLPLEGGGRGNAGASRPRERRLSLLGARSWSRRSAHGRAQSGPSPTTTEGGGGVAMVTYSVPFGGARRAWRGLLTADVRLARLDAIVETIELGRNGFGLVLSRSGVVIAVSKDHGASAGRVVLEQAAPASRAALSRSCAGCRAASAASSRPA